MRSPNYSVATIRSVGLFLGLLMCSLPLVAMATEFKPPRRGIPGRREGGGTRDAFICVETKPANLTALMPQTNFGLTTAAYPRFFWYMPQTRAKFAAFSLYESSENQEDKSLVYTTTFSISGTPGIASLTLPHQATLPPLAVGKDHRWSVAIICNPNDRRRDVLVEGWVQRITPDAALSSKLARADAGDRINLYAANGIWFDTLTTLADQRCANPRDTALTSSWTTLMKSVKLDKIAGEPLIQPCNQ
ncbi:DUF928 domain-containing protein [Leptothermofonsia sichuanensis E412]|uniref:DUF928 domain-containing protein n=1 Tax=Leptothermofonsia sichuanensis TaxID=2917832 RepID=UPI001CA6FEBC|nr:DUF928 domain-containing protein [Leptothermofonsia sichuanensis]QZZ21285.1 DUF928 domain-containing protein [Leptothermofonsia sichuanensis E412]